MKRVPLGEQELEVLKYVTEHQPTSVRDVAEAFAVSHGLARTTIITVLERLRTKGYLTRAKGDGAFEYRPTQDQGEIMKDLVRNFVASTLGGSVSSFVAYLAEGPALAPSEVAELRALVDQMDSSEESTKGGSDA
jgi:predicted transcriptional regulator